MGWLGRWEAQQAAANFHREERFSVMIDIVAELVGSAPRVIDLGSGPGSLAHRIVDRLPEAHVVAIDGDPFLLELGRRSVGDRGGRISWVNADLREPDWPQRLNGVGRVDAAVSTTALHWLSPAQLMDLAGQLAKLVRPAGVFIDGDHLTFDPDQPRLAQMAAAIKGSGNHGLTQVGESWTEWWQAAEREPAFAPLLKERSSQWGGHPDYRSPGEAAFLRAALLRAGFAEAGIAWQWLDNRVMVAVR